MMVFMSPVLVLIGQFCRDVIGRQNEKMHQLFEISRWKKECLYARLLTGLGKLLIFSCFPNHC